MAVKEGSFWTTTSGVVTGIAGTLTGLVAIATVATQMGWIGGSGGGDDPATVQSDGSTATTVAPGSNRGGTTGGATGSQGTSTPVFTVSPTSLSFEGLGAGEETVRVVNDGSVPVTLQSPRIEGTDAGQFSATAPTCTRGPLDPGRSCEIEVTFEPNRSGSFRATLVVQPTDRSVRAQEVSLSGRRIL